MLRIDSERRTGIYTKSVCCVVACVPGYPDAGRSHGRRLDHVSCPGGREQICTRHQKVHLTHLVLR